MSKMKKHMVANRFISGNADNNIADVFNVVAYHGVRRVSRPVSHNEQYTGKIDIEGNDGGYVLFDYEGKRYTYYNCFVESIADIK